MSEQNPFVRPKYRCVTRGCREPLNHPGARCHMCELEIAGWRPIAEAAVAEAIRLWSGER